MVREKVGETLLIGPPVDAGERKLTLLDPA